MAFETRFANFDLTTGLGDGSSEADAWQDWPTLMTGVNSLLSSGNHVRVGIKRTSARNVYASEINWSISTGEDKYLTLEGYDTVLGDGGIYEVEFAINKRCKFLGSGIEVKNIHIHGNHSDFIFVLNTGGSVAYNCGAFNSNYGGFYVRDSTITNCMTITSGPAVKLYRGQAFQCKFQRTTAGIGVIISNDYRASQLLNSEIWQNPASTSASSIAVHIDGATTTGSSVLATFNTIVGFNTGVKLSSPRQDGGSVFLFTGNVFANCDVGIQNDRTGFESLSVKSIMNGFYNCSTNIVSANSLHEHEINVASDPFLAAGSGDFSLNDIIDGGLRLKGKYPHSTGVHGEILNLGAYQG
jgi:hypothetical protein